MSETLKNVSDSLADIVEAAARGTVRIEGRRRLAATGIIWRAGVIVAAHHTVRADRLRVGLPDGETVSATLAGRDKATDLAVLHIDAGPEPLPLAGDDDPPRVGQLVLALGRPGKNIQATLGVVSAAGGRWLRGAIQTDVVMYPGFSGGPLVDASGKVQGMNTSGFRRGISIAVATDTINRVVTALLEHGHVRQGYLGVGAQPVRLPAELAAELDQETGLLLASVEPGSPAAAAGLHLGDTLVALDDQPLAHLDALLVALSGERIGQSAPVKFIRGGQVQELNVTIGEKEEDS
jgi:S1-C subfamily serine protease